MAVSDKFSCSRSKSWKQKPVLPEEFVNYLQMKMREYKHSLVLRTHWPEDVSILASAHKLKDTRMRGCEDTKRTWTGRYENVRMQGYKQPHMNMRIWGCKDILTLMNLRIWGCKGAGIQASTQELDDSRMQGYKQGRMNPSIWGCKDVKMQASTHERKDMRMQGCEDTSKCKGT